MLIKINEIIAIGRKLYEKGLIAGFDGNLSYKINQEEILITASNVHKGMLREKHIITINSKKDIIKGSLKPSTETQMHLEIYKHTDANAIIHAHAPYSIAASITLNQIDLTSVLEGRLLFKKVPLVPELEPGTKELADAAKEAAMISKVFILKAHGVVAWGKSLLEAFGLIESLEHNIKIMAIKRLFK